MADPLSISASIVGLIGLADRVIRASQYCIDTVRDAPTDIRMIHGEVSSLKAIFESFGKSDGTTTSKLFGSEGPVEACRRSLTGLEALLPANRNSQAVPKRRRITIAELAWPLKQTKARKILADLSHHKATLLLAISGDMIHELRDIRAGLDRLQGVMSDSERRQVSQWLERTNPSSLHNIAVAKHEPLTSVWLVRSPEWTDWLDVSSINRFLWIYGIPGAGKTVLASFAIEELKKLFDGRDGYVCAYYYCHYSHNQDEAAPFLSWVISQVCRQIKQVPRRLKTLYDQGCDVTLSELEHILEMVLERLENLCLVIDAVDESAPRESLVRLIATMALDSRFEKVRIMATSRQYLDIERIFSGMSTSISMSNPLVDVDIRSFARARLTSSYRLKRWQHMHQAIEDVLVAKAQGMFRWVDCQIRAIERLRDEHQLREALQNLPPDLTETYVRIFEAIPEADWLFVRQVLIWIYGHACAPWVAQRGLNVKLLLSAVAYDLHGPGSDTRHRLFDCEYLQELLGCLITIETVTDKDIDTSLYGQPTEDCAESLVSLAHYTVFEFLTSRHILQTRVAFFALPLETIEAEFAASVLRQALTADPNGTSADWDRDREAYCLTLGCALNSWDYTEVQQLLVQYLDPSNPHYTRFRTIQIRICSDDNDSFGFYLGYLPAELYSPSSVGGHDPAAEVLLNLLLLPGCGAIGEWAPFVQQLAAGRSIQDLLGTRVSGSFVKILAQGLPGDRYFDGTVRDVANVGLVEGETMVELLAEHYNTYPPLRAAGNITIR